MNATLPETWADLEPQLSGDWTDALAWAVAGGDPDGFDIRLKGGRVIYEAAWVVFGSRGSERVRLARVVPRDGGLHKYVRWVKPDDALQIRRSKVAR